MSEVKRFFTAIGHEGTPYVDMIEDDSGDYVYYDEYKKIRAQLAEAQGEISKLHTSIEEYEIENDKWRNYYNNLKQENAALRARLNRIEEVYKKYKPFFNVNSAVCDCEEELWQAIKATCEVK